MAKIRFENGKTVNFEGNPTPEDVDFVAKQIGISSTPDVSQERQQRIAQGLPVSVREDRAEPTVGGSILRAPLQLGAKILSTPLPAARAIAAEDTDPYRPIKSEYLGDIYSPGGKAARSLQQGTYIDPNKSLEQNIGRAIGQSAKGTLDVAGTGAEAASYAVGGGALPQLGKQSLLKFARQEALSGGLGGFGASTQQAVEEAKTVQEGLGAIAKGTALGTGIGLAGGGILGGASRIPSAVRSITPTSETIMNRVARLTPTDAKKFEKLAGKSHGKYLEETGNFGRPDEIVTNEASKFVQSMKDVDDTLAQLPGTYKPKELIDVITPLEDRLVRVQSPDAGRVIQLRNKLNTTGLNMSEINEIKRLYERNVKLAYNKLNNPDAVELATNLDNRLREWQVKQADMLGFENIKELNKQTQLARFVADKLGEQLVGKSGLDGMNITDWIMLSGGDPTSVAGLITKKFFSSPGIQSRIARFLSKAEKALPIKPKLGETKIPRLPAGRTEVPSTFGGSTINVAPKGANVEFTGKIPGVIPEKPSQQLLKGKSVKKALPPLSSKTAGKSKLPTKPNINEDLLIKEAKKYKSAEEFVKAQPKLYHGGSADIKDIQLGKSNFQKTFYMSENPDYAKSFGGNKSSLNEIMVDSKAKLADLRKPSDDLVKQIEDIISSKPTGKTVRIQKPDGTFLEIPETKGGLSNPVHSSKDILNGIRQGKAYFAEMPEVKKALKKLGYDGMITQESKMGTNFGVWNKDILKTKSQLEEIWNKANKK